MENANGYMPNNFPIRSNFKNQNIVDEFFESISPEDYLEAIARGETPRWDSEKGGYVYSNDETAEVSLGGKSTSKSINEVNDPQSNDEIDENLPF